MTEVRIRRIYDPPDGGRRVLVDRLWPRGLSRDAADLDAWAKHLAPSTGLREWYHDDPVARYDEFCARYLAELDVAETSELLAELAEADQVTLLTAVKYPPHSHVPILLDWLAERGFTPAQ